MNRDFLLYIVILLLVSALIYTYLYWYEPLKQKEKLLQIATFPAKMPSDAVEILKELNLSCYGASCYEYHRYDSKLPYLECWIVIGKKLNDTCIIKGRAFGMGCIKANETSWDCSISAYAPYDYEEGVKILFWDRGKCCWLTGYEKGKARHECREESLLKCVKRLFSS